MIDNLKETFTTAEKPFPGLGPATTVTVAVDTTPKGVVALKGVSKVFGGVVSLGQTTYDVYVDYQTFGASENFLKTAGVDVGITAITAVGAGAAVSFGAPVIAVTLGSGYIVYLVNENLINPWKMSLENEE